MIGLLFFPAFVGTGVWLATDFRTGAQAAWLTLALELVAIAAFVVTR